MIKKIYFVLGIGFALNTHTPAYTMQQFQETPYQQPLEELSYEHFAEKIVEEMQKISIITRDKEFLYRTVLERIYNYTNLGLPTAEYNIVLKISDQQRTITPPLLYTPDIFADLYTFLISIIPLHNELLVMKIEFSSTKRELNTQETSFADLVSCMRPYSEEETELLIKKLPAMQKRFVRKVYELPVGINKQPLNIK